MTQKGAYNYNNIGDVNPGSLQSRLIALTEFSSSSTPQNIVHVPVNASFVRIENHSGHSFKATFIDKYQQSFDMLIIPFQTKTLNLPARLLIEVQLYDYTQEPLKATDPYAMITTVAGAEDDAPIYPSLVSAGSFNFTQWSAGYIAVQSGPYAIDVEDFALPQIADDNTVFSGVISTGLGQSLNIQMPFAAGALQFTGANAVGSSLFHNLVVVNNSTTNLTGIVVYADITAWTLGGDAISFSVPQGIFSFPISFWGVKVQSTASGQQLIATMRRTGTWGALNNGTM